MGKKTSEMVWARVNIKYPKMYLTTKKDLIDHVPKMMVLWKYWMKLELASGPCLARHVPKMERVVSSARHACPSLGPGSARRARAMLVSSRAGSF